MAPAGGIWRLSCWTASAKHRKQSQNGASLFTIKALPPMTYFLQQDCISEGPQTAPSTGDQVLKWPPFWGTQPSLKPPQCALAVSLWVHMVDRAGLHCGGGSMKWSLAVALGNWQGALEGIEVNPGQFLSQNYETARLAFPSPLDSHLIICPSQLQPST